MGRLSIGTLQQSSFGIEALLEEGRLCLSFSGTGDLEAVEPLAEYLDKAFEDVERLKLPAVKFDFRRLEFMNSSCFKAFVTFIERSREPGLSIVFVTDPARGYNAPPG